MSRDGWCLLAISKAVFYFALISYQVIDIGVDWSGYTAFKSDKPFAVVPKDNSIACGFYVFSCVAGTLFSLLLVIVYGLYILSHLQPEGSSDNSFGFVTNMETVISVCELLFKDDVQSILIFLIYHSDPHTKCVSFITKFFTVCSIMAHTKLLLCFSMKLLGIGKGEEDERGGINKTRCCLAFFGCVGSLVFLVITSLKFAEMQNWLPYDHSLASVNCTRHIP